MERKSYEAQDRSKTSKESGLSMPTFFVLTKKDRAGKVMTRPFHAILEEMKRQETEEAKLKQSSSIKGTQMSKANQQVPKENGVARQPPPAAVAAPPPPPAPTQNHKNSATIEPIPIVPPPVITIKDDDPADILNASMKANNSDDQSLKSPEIISVQNNSTKLFNRQPRSRACEIL